MTRSLRSRLAALVLTALVCITAVLVIVLVRGDARQVERERAALLVQGLTIGQAAIADDLLVEDYARARGFLATLALDPQVRFAALVDDDDRIIVHVGRRHENKRLEDVLPADALPLVARVRARLTAEVRRISNGELIAMSPVALGGNGVRLRSGRVGLLIMCSGDRAALARAYARTAVEVSAITLIVLVLLLLIYFVLERDVSRPLERFMSVIARLREGDLGARVARQQDDEFGRLARAFDDALDTIERQTAAITTSEARLRRTNELVGVVNLEWDLVQRTLDVPARLWDMLGRPVPSGPLAMDAFTALVDPVDRERFAECLEQTLSAGRAFAEEFRMCTADGATVWLQVQGDIETDANGKPLRLLALAQDVSARKIAEQRQAELTAQLHMAQKLEAVGLLSNGIAHDFNNILAAVIGFVRLGRRNKGAGDAQAIDEYLDEIEAAAMRGRELVAQLVTFSQGQPGGSRVLDLNGVVGEVMRLLKPLLPADVMLTFTHAPDLPLVVADAVSAQQIALNLCLNARDAQPHGGHIDVSLKPLDVDEMRCDSCLQRFSGRFVELAVSDHGDGIPPPMMARIFDPFFTTKRDGAPLDAASPAGSGLGLSVVHGAIHQVGGHVTVRSEAGRGTRFAVCFPCHGKAAPAARAGAAASPALNEA